jgi:hypothetical protein
MNGDVTEDDDTSKPPEIWIHDSARAALEEAEHITARTLLSRSSGGGGPVIARNMHHLSSLCAQPPLFHSMRDCMLKELQLLDGIDSLCISSSSCTGDELSSESVSASAARRYLLAAHKDLSPLLRSPPAAAPYLESHMSMNSAPPLLLLTWHGQPSEGTDAAADSHNERAPPRTQQLTSTVRRREESDDVDDAVIDPAATDAAMITDEDLLVLPTPKKLRWEGCQIPWQNRRVTASQAAAAAPPLRFPPVGERDGGLPQLTCRDDMSIRPPPRKLLVSEAFLRRARGCEWSVRSKTNDPLGNTKSRNTDDKEGAAPAARSTTTNGTTVVTQRRTTPPPPPPPPISASLRSRSPLPLQLQRKICGSGGLAKSKEPADMQETLSAHLVASPTTMPIASALPGSDGAVLVSSTLSKKRHR